MLQWIKKQLGFCKADDLSGVLTLDCCDGSNSELRWRKLRLTQEKHSNGWGSWESPGVLQMYTQYYCSKCDGELTPGPSGGGTNQVCEKCRINYGCLPDALER